MPDPELNPPRASEPLIRVHASIVLGFLAFLIVCVMLCCKWLTGVTLW